MIRWLPGRLDLATSTTPLPFRRIRASLRARRSASARGEEGVPRPVCDVWCFSLYLAMKEVKGSR